MLPAREQRISPKLPKRRPKPTLHAVSGAWLGLSRREPSPIRLTLANNATTHRTAAAGPVTNSTLRRSQPLQNLPSSIWPVTKHRIMHRGCRCLFARQLINQSVPPQARRCAVIHAAASTPAATARLQEHYSYSSAACHGRVLQRHREHRACTWFQALDATHVWAG
jgi:hypothetical protein